MFDDNFMFLNDFHTPSRGPLRCYYNNYDPYYYTDSEREYLAALEEQERNRRYQAALEEQAYLEMLERKRQQKLLEERRQKQYLLELERRRYEQEQEQARRQYLARLEQKRQEKLKEQNLHNSRRAAALEALKRKEKMKRDDRVGNQFNPLHQIIEGLDGNLYKVLFNPTDSELKTQEDRRLKIATNDYDIGRPSICQKKSSHGKNKTCTKMDCSNDTSESPPMPNVTFKDCFNINMNNEDNDKNAKKKKIIPRKRPKSSILLGDVEDASDSECEDEFNDYMHTRRPADGQWIEPVECILNSSEKFKK